MEEEWIDLEYPIQARGQLSKIPDIHCLSKFVSAPRQIPSQLEWLQPHSVQAFPELLAWQHFAVAVGAASPDSAAEFCHQDFPTM